MFGSRSSARPKARSLLLVLVFGAFLAIIGITATAQAALVSLHVSTSTLNAVVASDSATVRAVLDDSLVLRDLDPGTAASAVSSRLQTELHALTDDGGVLRVELRRLDGTIVAASDPALAGGIAPASAEASAAAGGAPKIAIVPATDAAAGPGSFSSATLLREFLPISTDDQVRGVVGIWRDAVPLLARLETVRRDVVVVTLSAALVAALLLLAIFRGAQGRLSRQTAALIEAARRDPLTGLLNHGALVDHLAAAIERSRATDAPIGIALADLDNLRLLNETHGHDAGDAALLAVAAELARQLPDDVAVGRFGPDEFLAIAPAGSVVELEPAIAAVRAALADRSLQFEATERLPVTISAGLCVFPEHGSSATTLLAAVTRVLEEAKASGGDTVKVAGPAEPEPAAARSGFDVLQGLVLAIDTKDRYTKRHSEDVSRYGVYLAEQIGLDPDLIAAIRLAGLLHDIGKIGIPDEILRKPGRLTPDEYAIVKQHVALGDMIVRDVPDIDQVRAGIRHHHERWDGEGYLHRLAGEQIPLIARVLAVGDAFSAMTTTRPYRKALEVREALTRLGDAAGTQLDEALVTVFVRGIETDAEAPLPGVGAPARRAPSGAARSRRIA
ncbi:MAG TPA: diguanylate cyclase [Candidatus Limnocylindrales bacterium]|nr:diguanylate cyclase [Candidatus Limnocylindrales bacterium]